MSCVLLYRRTLFDASFIDFQTHLLAQDGLKELLSSHYGLQWHEFCPGYLIQSLLEQGSHVSESLILELTCLVNSIFARVLPRIEKVDLK